jgi:putative endonuclease
MKDLKHFGEYGEERAVKLLSSRGFQIVERNYRYGKLGEIDIIAQKDSLVVFAEVKNRSSSYFGGPLYSITPSKKKKIAKVAQFFLAQNPQYNSKDFIHRFDLIAIEDDEIQWVEDIIR